MIVRESINFERGGDPLTSMGIGRRFIQISKITGMTPAELRITKSRLNNFFTKDLVASGIKYKDFMFVLGDAKAEPLNYNVRKDSATYDDILWALQYPKESFELIHMKDSQIYEAANFERGQDPKASMGIGRRLMIEDWIEAVNSHEIYSEYDAHSRFSKNPENHIAGYHINDDLTIDVRTNTGFGDALIIRGQEMIELPEFIQFGKCEGNFYINVSRLRTMRGFPKIITGHLCVNHNQLTSLDYLPEEIGGGLYISENKVKFTKEEIRKRCKIGGRELQV